MTHTSLEKIINYHFKDQALLTEALTHASLSKKKNYERLEFLGDRVLGLVIAETLYKRFPNEAEGPMAKRLAALVQGTMLATIATEINLGQFIKFSESEKAAGGSQNENILADIFESIIGAMYLDGGLAPCADLIASLWEDKLDQMIAPPQHPKTQIQEWAQAQNLDLPQYDLTQQSGPDHAPAFIITLTVGGHAPVKGTGKSRQSAEKNAAKTFIETHIT